MRPPQPRTVFSLPILWSLIALSVVGFLTCQVLAADGRGFTYLDDPCNPFYPTAQLARLSTPQWIGEPGVDAVVVLSIDDLKDPKQYEAFLRPIFERLKAIDGRAPVSIMTVKTDPQHPLLQKWLAEGVSLEVHTSTHPCPLLQGGDFEAAKKSYEDGVDHLAAIPGVTPRALRIPCCDSMSSPSPRFYAEIFSGKTPQGRFLSMDSSVLLVFTSADPELPREITIDEEGRERFAKYIPPERELGTYIENYPYPYVINRRCWEVPVLAPSDWNGQRLNGKCHPTTLRDWQRAVDAVVVKKGIWALCFHPHGWISAEQIISLIDYAVGKYGSRVKFLTFSEVLARLENHLLDGQPLRRADGGENGVYILDVNSDGWMDVVLANDQVQKTRIWVPQAGRWLEYPFPVKLAYAGSGNPSLGTSIHFGAIDRTGQAAVLIRQGETLNFYRWTDTGWKESTSALAKADDLWRLGKTCPAGDIGIRFRDINGDGADELIVAGPELSAVYRWHGPPASAPNVPGEPRKSSALDGCWEKLPFALPAPLVDNRGRDAGTRLVDLDGDGDLDVLASSSRVWLVAKFVDMETGWTVVRRGDRTSGQAPPPFVDDQGANMGVWFKFGRLWIQNEHTGRWVGEGPGRFRLAADWIALAELLRNN